MHYIILLCNKVNTSSHHNGIDRIDNNKGYFIGNINSCCATCNYLKNKFELKTILDHCYKIALNS